MEKNFVKVYFINGNYEVVKFVFVQADSIIEATEKAKKWYKEEKKTFEYWAIEAEYLNITL